MFQNLSKKHLHYLLVAVCFLLMVPFLIGFADVKNITIKYDNQVKKVATSSNIPKLILINAGIKLESGDGWKIEGGEKKLQEGSVIRVIRGVPFSVTYNGQTKSFKSSKETVGEALKDINVTFYDGKVYPPTHAKLQKNLRIFVVNATDHLQVTNDVNAKAKITYIDDNKLACGLESLEKPGKAPKTKIVSRRYLDNNNKMVTEVLGRVEIEPGVNAIVRRGTALSVKTPQGYKAFKKQITCEATAYTHTGNRTCTGIMPYVGVVAVDPRTIPLGTKMYIPGYGMALAADTGGAIKGHIIDLFMNTEAECFRWGRRNVQVYILE